MATPMHDDVRDFAGDFNLKSIVIHNHAGEGFDSSQRGVDIKKLVVEFNIYESIYKSAITGSIVIADTINLIGRLPIQGTERLSFKLATPGAHADEHLIDCTERTGHPMHIYKLTDRQQVSEGQQTYTLHFCSREFLRNMRTKVSQTYSGTFDTMVQSIFQDKDYLDSRKTLFSEKTRNQDKITIPNLNPFAAIELISRRSLANERKGAGYHFYETSKGFHFRSFESMCVEKGGQPRDIKQVFRYFMSKMTDENLIPEKGESEVSKIRHDYTNVEQYRFINNFHDVAANTALGTYGHRVITHNIFDKSYKIDDYNYHESFLDTKHTDKGYRNYAIVDTPVDWDTKDEGEGNKGVSDYPESRVTVQPSTRFAHNEDTGSFGIDSAQDGIIEGQRLAQENQVHAGTKLELLVKGESALEAGDVIEFQIRSVDANNPDGEVDPQYAGRYIITKIRHRVTKEDYVQVLECTKDSPFKPYASSSDKYFYGRSVREISKFKDIV